MVNDGSDNQTGTPSAPDSTQVDLESLKDLKISANEAMSFWLKSPSGTSNEREPKAAPDASSAPTEAPQSPCDKTLHAEVTPAPAGDGLNTHDINIERGWLEKNFEYMSRYMSQEEQAQYRKDMKAFEERAQRSHMNPAEVANTYYEISQLLESKETKHTSPADRLKLAQQVLHHSACPQDIDQGNHYTCSVTTMESRMFTRNPAAAAHLITEVATTGEFKTADGQTVHVNPINLQPDRESQDQPPPVTVDGHRSYASQIFQVSAITMFWQRQSEGPDLQGKELVHVHGKKGDWEFVQNPGPSRNGETGEQLLYKGRVVDDNPHLFNSNLQEMSNQITGQHEESFCLAASAQINPKDKHSLIGVDSPEDLATKLAQMKKHGQLPAIISVNSRYEPYWTDSGAGHAGGSGFPHVITVTDISADGKTVSMVNERGMSSHHQLSVENLYQTMLTPNDPESIKRLEHETQVQDQTKPLGWQHLEVLRMQIQSNQEPADIVKQLQSFREQSEKRWKKEKGSNTLDPDERVRTMREFDLLLDWLKIHNPDLKYKIDQKELKSLYW